jgi:hypothetical protein
MIKPLKCSRDSSRLYYDESNGNKSMNCKTGGVELILWCIMLSRFHKIRQFRWIHGSGMISPMLILRGEIDHPQLHTFILVKIATCYHISLRIWTPLFACFVWACNHDTDEYHSFLISFNLLAFTHRSVDVDVDVSVDVDVDVNKFHTLMTVGRILIMVTPQNVQTSITCTNKRLFVVLYISLLD